jgi:O-antigen/teichoic acid export membrane protein
MTATAFAVAVFRRRERRAIGAASGASLLTLATVASGAFTYAFLVLAARSLGKEAYGQIGVLWAAMFLVAILVFRPLEQTTSQAIAHRLAGGTEAKSVLRSMSLVSLGVAGALACCFAVTWPLLSRELFASSNALTAAFVVGVLAYGVSYVVRGVLGGARWFGGYAIVLLADGGIRLLVAAPLLVVGSKDVAAAAVAAAGIGGAVVPLLAGRRRLRGALAGGSAAPFRARRAASFAGPAAIVAGADQLLVNGAPLLVVAVGTHDRAAVGLVFAATMLVRAPVYVFQGFAASLLPNLTHLVAVAGRAELRRAVLRTAVVLFAIGIVFIAFASLAGPAAMRAVYGQGFDASPVSLALLAAGVACYLAAGTFSQALLALRHVGAAAVAWSVAALSFVGSFALLPGEALLRASAALAVASLVAAVALGATLVVRAR